MTTPFLTNVVSCAVEAVSCYASELLRLALSWLLGNIFQSAGL